MTLLSNSQKTKRNNNPTEHHARQEIFHLRNKFANAWLPEGKLGWLTGSEECPVRLCGAMDQVTCLKEE